MFFFFFSSRRRHTRFDCDWSSDVCSSDLVDVVTSAEKIAAPGQLPKHYAPKAPLQLIENANSFSPKPNQRCALLAWNALANDKRFVAIRNLSERQDLRQAAANLFRYLRELDVHDV